MPATPALLTVDLGNSTCGLRLWEDGSDAAASSDLGTLDTRAPEFAERLSTRHAFLAGEVFHFAYHLGQLGSLRADLGLGWA